MHATSDALTEAKERDRRSWWTVAFGAVILVTSVARVWLICHYPEPDGDAKGHLGIAAALRTHPLSVAVHWVWPPGYHYLLAALLAVGFTAKGVRFLNCFLATVLPFLVWSYAKRTLESTNRVERLVPLLAGVLCAAMPIVNVLGTSAQQGTLFAILVLAAVWAIDTDHFVVGGAVLAAAAMVRYEAWGAIALLVGSRAFGFSSTLMKRLPPSLARVCRLPLVVGLLPLIAVAGWFTAHRVADGSWLAFLRELYRYTHAQRETFRHDAWTEALWFPVMQPYYLFGLALPLFLVGARRAWRTGFIVPLGIYLFLLGSYTFKGALGSGRYYESLTPFVCISTAYGASAIGARWRPAMALAFTIAFAHVVWLLVLNTKWTFHL